MGEWYFTICQEMREMGLKGNELLVFALIHNRSHYGSGCWYGSIETLCEICGISSRQTATTILKSLQDKGFINKSTIVINGEPRNAYVAMSKNWTPVQKLDTLCPKNGHNIKDNINIKIDSNKRETFKKPSVSEVAEYCKERNNGIDPEEFIAHYESNGWMVGKTKMKDWKSAIITWEKSRKRKETSSPHKASQKESVFAHNLKVMDAMFGTSNYEKAYGKKEVIDEQ